MYKYMPTKLKKKEKRMSVKHVETVENSEIRYFAFKKIRVMKKLV